METFPDSLFASPFHALARVLDEDTHVVQFCADAIGFGEIPILSRRNALCNQGFDFRVIAVGVLALLAIRRNNGEPFVHNR